jgi:hypothetical protein
MQITVWSVAADDDNGTYASVHETESAAYRRLIQLTVDSDNKDDVAKAEAFMEAEDFDRLDEWIHEEVIEPLNTYSVDQHKLDVPTIPSGTSRREQAHHAPRTRQRTPRLAAHARTMGAENPRLHFHRSSRAARTERTQLLRSLLRRRRIPTQPR